MGRLVEVGKTLRRAMVWAAAGACFLALSSSALAASLQKPPAYQGQGGNVQAKVQKVTTSGKTLGALPFTGLDLAFIVGGGLVLLLTGATLRRAARSRA
jgi:hypothetical protein